MTSAQTRHTLEPADQLKIVHLANNCQDLIRDGSRTPEMVNALRLALQMFKDNRLGGVVSTVTLKASDMSASQVLDLFSLKVAETGIPPRCRDYLHARGVLYIGEILQIKWDKKPPERTLIEAFMESLGLPMSYTVDTFGWKPPYTTDTGIKALWDKPIGEVLHGWMNRTIILLRYHNCGIHYAGQLAGLHNGSPGKMRDLQTALGPNSKLHAGMVVRDWSPPAAGPQEWEQLKEWHRQERLPPRDQHEETDIRPGE